MVQERFTSQKKLILEFVKNTKKHPSAQEVYLEVKNKLPRISKATVYRILKSFVKEGRLREIPLKISRFDGDISPHAHFFCEKCHRLYDVFDEKINLDIQISIGQIKRKEIIYYGICKNCLQRSS